MSTFLIAIAAFFGFIVAYNTYGRWLSRKIFQLDKDAEVPSVELRDDVDYVPSRKSIVFGHHFTSIAGTGPIVGPAIAVFWGWLPALLWVVFGSIFIGAVHDFGALVVSLRNRGQTVGEVAGRLISSRTRILFLLILFFALTVVLAIFGLVIASIFAIYPGTVLPVWVSLPIAIVAGVLVYKRGVNLLPISLVALVLIYLCIYLGAYHLEIRLPETIQYPIVVWTVILLGYCAIASVLPIWLLLQPRDYINSHQLIVALGLLMIGLLIATLTGQANLFESAPAVVRDTLPEGTPPIWPFLFITIACGAVSGFHCLVSSGTSSKQISNECDAQYVGYGAMLLEGALAVVVILACCAGVGMGVSAGDETLVGNAAWNSYYDSSKGWAEFGLAKKVGAFVDGGANFLTAIGVPHKMGVGIIAVLVACFAATTLDTATRLQRYVIQELGTTLKLPPLKNMYVATGTAVILGGIIAMLPGKYTADGAPIYGSGGLLLWPLFGATNQLLAGLAFLVTVFYLWRRNKPIWFAGIPMIIMIILPAWALIWQLFDQPQGWVWSVYDFEEGKFGEPSGTWLLAFVGLTTLGLQIWLVIEAIVMWPKAKGVLEEALPPLPQKSMAGVGSDARSC